jgi:CrcB protein
MTGLALVLLVAAAGGIGAACRFVVDGTVRAHTARAVPTGTAVVNVTGSLAIGLLEGAALWHGLGHSAFVVAALGFCGGYTTFSTAMVDTVRLVEQGHWRRAAGYVLGTLTLCVAAASVGVGLMWLAR